MGTAPYVGTEIMGNSVTHQPEGNQDGMKFIQNVLMSGSPGLSETVVTPYGRRVEASDLRKEVGFNYQVGENRPG
jgi:hypothetical protein